MSPSARDTDAPTQRFASKQQLDELRSVAIRQSFRNEDASRCPQATIRMRVDTRHAMPMSVKIDALHNPFLSREGCR
ncbi:hypothetical protein CupriaWKF_14255 [Cupriavidus sp. WKF15]|uniref:hypothetical protein n=1 Tax=Cupriavidus sp. WKF15 TaxID=3032282 RepID=UPI0023E281FA|nr:hypothetical protein [Cupriavidus sp. WKF15]WER45452.1 hypothetical protein CupriaWKF_14255 [Cupriavidus sp. WKF15]